MPFALYIGLIMVDVASTYHSYACAMHNWITPMSRIHYGRSAIISTHAQCLAGSSRSIIGVCNHFNACALLTWITPMSRSIKGVCNYSYACAMPSWITPMSRIHHGRSAIISTHAHCAMPSWIVQIHHRSVQLFLRMRNAYLDRPDPS